jgi:hypothetical protein
MQVNYVLVFENKELSRIDGLTYYNYPSQLDSIIEEDLSDLVIRYEVGINYAGLISEKILLQSISGSSKTPLFVSEGSADDNKTARGLIKKYNLANPGKQRSKYKQELLQEIRHELYEYWDDVILVSHALFAKHKLAFDDLQNLLTKRSKNKSFWKEQFKKINCLYDPALDIKNLRFILSVSEN